MKYISSREAAEKWGLSERRIRYLCTDKKIENAVLFGNQWMIPDDAPRPVDGRTKAAKDNINAPAYHFPVFIYTRYYALTSELSDDERELLQAQKYHLEGRYADDMAICRRLIETSKESHVVFGAYYTMAFALQMTGIPSEFHLAVKELKRLAHNEKYHREDYEMMLGALRYQTSWNADSLLATDVSRLSGDAVCFYTYFIMVCSLLSNARESAEALCIYEAFCRAAENDGILPMLLVAHCILSVMYTHNGNAETAKGHIQTACKIAVQRGWITLLAKFFNGDSHAIREELMPYGEKYVEEVERTASIGVRNWNHVRCRETGTNIPHMFTSDEYEFMLLLSYGMSINDIVAVKNMSIYYVKKMLADLNEKCGTADKNELVAYAKKILETQTEKK